MNKNPKRKSSRFILFTIGLIAIQSLLLVGIPYLSSTNTNLSFTDNLSSTANTSETSANTSETSTASTGQSDLQTPTTELSSIKMRSIKGADTSSDNITNDNKKIDKKKLPAIIANSIERRDRPAEESSDFKWHKKSIVLAGLRNSELLSDSSSPLSLENDNANNRLSLAYHVKSGDTLSSIWKSIGGDIDQAHAAAVAFKKADVSLSSLKAGEILDFTVTSSGHVEELKKPLNDGQSLVLTSTKLGGFSPEVVRPQVIETEKFVSGTITHSLAHASIQQGVPYEVVDEFIDLFSGRVEFSREVQAGDTFTVIYDERNTESGNSLSPGPIQAASFMNAGELFVALRYQPKSENSKANYYNSKGEPIGNHFLRYPLKFSRISSVFTKARFHPVLKRWRPHHGVDFAAPTGTPVRTVADGKVVKAGYHGGNGNMVKIQHNEKHASAYLHLSRIAKGIRVGSRVERGQLIGAVGSTGLATGPHLHYSFYVHGKYVDPLKVKLPSVAQNVPPIPQKYLRSTLRKLRREHADLKIASTNLLKRSA